VNPWREIADRVFIRRFAFFDQTIGAVVGRDRILVIDTRSTLVQARELLDDLRHVSALPHVVLNTHAHFDHVLGNAAFRPCEIWGEDGCARFMRQLGLERRAEMAAEMPGIAADLLASPVDPPDRTFAREAALDLGGRRVDLRFLGRGHTDHDVVALVPDAEVVFAGDLVEEGAPPSFGDAFPLDWPATLGQLLDASGGGQVVPGHGEVVDRDFVAAQLADIVFLAEMARRQWPDLRAAGHDPAGPAPEYIAADVARHLGWPLDPVREGLARAIAQAAGRLGVPTVPGPPGYGGAAPI
jgi:glyoxylase-like metal-dependent hydrolase (beta-lactamase superfamily II)